MEKNWVPERIKGERLNLRPIDWENIVEDARKVVNWAKDEEVREALKYFSFFQDEVALGRQLRFFFRMIESRNDQIFIAETPSGEFIGTCGLHDLDWFNESLRVGIIIFNKNYWRKGYGREIVGLLLRFAFEVLRMNKVYLTVRADNSLAIHIYQHLGFQKEGILRQEYKVRAGHYVDLLRMSILRKEWKKWR
jgi:RimJ/RimL family protein N-acetyltransferase